MQRTMVEEFTSTPEGMAEFQQERVILDVAILIRRLLKEKGLTQADLAARLSKTKAFVAQLLDGRANMTLRTISDVMCALGHSLNVTVGPLSVQAIRPETMVITMDWKQPAPIDYSQTSQVDYVGANSVTCGPVRSNRHELRIAG
jgi:transcriptional regulator with XRE-family HTH domain